MAMVKVGAQRRKYPQITSILRLPNAHLIWPSFMILVLSMIKVNECQPQHGQSINTFDSIHEPKILMGDFLELPSAQYWLYDTGIIYLYRFLSIHKRNIVFVKKIFVYLTKDKRFNMTPMKSPSFFLLSVFGPGREKTTASNVKEFWCAMYSLKRF